jgi:hypothetical protein
MPFPYTFPFVFDEPIILAAGEVGLGVEAAVLSASFASDEGGTGAELSVMLKEIFSCEEGSGADGVKILTGRAGYDLKIHPHRGQVSITHKEVNL